MALTLEQEAVLLALLDEKRITLPELTATTEIKADDLLLTNQLLADKSVTAKVLKEYIAPPASLDVPGIVQLTNSVESDSEIFAVTAKAVKKAYQLSGSAYQLADTANTTANMANQLANTASISAESRLSKAANFSDVPNKSLAINNLGLEARLYPVGAPIPWPSNNVPAGYLKCNGATFNKSQYPKLALAYPSGRLPDLRGEFIRGWDDGRGADSGRSLLTYQSDASQRITGSIDMARRGGGAREEYAGAFRYGSRFSARIKSGENDDWGSKIEFDSALVSRTASETRPRNIAFLYIVKAA